MTDLIGCLDCLDKGWIFWVDTKVLRQTPFGVKEGIQITKINPEQVDNFPAKAIMYDVCKCGAGKQNITVDKKRQK